MEWIVGFDPGFVRRDEGGWAGPSGSGSGRPRAREGRAGTGGDRGGRRDGRSGSGAPSRRVASVTVPERAQTRMYGQPATAGERPAAWFRGRPFPGAWDDPKPGKRASEAGRSPGARPASAFPAALPTRPRPLTAPPCGRPNPECERHALPPAPRARAPHRGLADSRIYDYSICHAHRMRDQRPTSRPNRLRRVRARSRKSPLSEWAFSLVPAASRRGLGPFGRGKPPGGPGPR